MVTATATARDRQKKKYRLKHLMIKVLKNQNLPFFPVFATRN
jgi:hypothetical protein